MELLKGIMEELCSLHHNLEEYMKIEHRVENLTAEYLRITYSKKITKEKGIASRTKLETLSPRGVGATTSKKSSRKLQNERNQE